MSEQSPQNQSWYFAREGKQHGPYTGTDIMRLAQIGELRADDLIWRPGFETWKPVHSVAGLATQPSGAVDATAAKSDGRAEMESAAQSAAEAEAEEAATPAELEPNWQRVAAVAWLIVWRSLVGSILVGFAVGYLAGFIMGFAGYDELEIRAIATILSSIAGFVVLALVVPMALKKRYADFRLAMVPRDRPEDAKL